MEGAPAYGRGLEIDDPVTGKEGGKIMRCLKKPSYSYKAVFKNGKFSGYSHIVGSATTQNTVILLSYETKLKL